MLPSGVSEKFAGLWMIDSGHRDPNCRAIEVGADSARGSGLVARLLYWKPGRSGCDSCSSDVGSVELTGEFVAGELILTGSLPHNDPAGGADRARISVSLTEQGLEQGTLRGAQGGIGVVLRAREFVAPFEVV